MDTHRHEIVRRLKKRGSRALQQESDMVVENLQGRIDEAVALTDLREGDQATLARQRYPQERRG